MVSHFATAPAKTRDMDKGPDVIAFALEHYHLKIRESKMKLLSGSRCNSYAVYWMDYCEDLIIDIFNSI